MRSHTRHHTQFCLMLYIVMKKWTFLETSVEFLKIWSKSLFLEINIWQRIVPCFARASRDPVASPVRFHVPWPPYPPGYPLHPLPFQPLYTWFLPYSVANMKVEIDNLKSTSSVMHMSPSHQISCSTVEPLSLWIPLIISSSSRW